MHDEREEKLKKLTVNIQQSTAKKDTGAFWPKMRLQ
jgi:hypothetical protein